jgi:restriction endonuclease S subunit
MVKIKSNLKQPPLLPKWLGFWHDITNVINIKKQFKEYYINAPQPIEQQQIQAIATPIIGTVRQHAMPLAFLAYIS